MITKYTLGTSEAKFVKVGLVRQGHAVTQLTVSALQFENSAGTMYGPCSAFTPAIDPDPKQNDPKGRNPSLRNNPKGNCNQVAIQTIQLEQQQGALSEKLRSKFRSATFSLVPSVIMITLFILMALVGMSRTVLVVTLPP